MENQRRESIRAIVRTMYDFQAMRIRIANRLKITKTGEAQNQIELDEIELDENTLPTIRLSWENSLKTEKELEKTLQKELKGIPVYDEFLSKVKGCGPVMAGVIISEFDIEKATTVSKMWQYCGLNPGKVKGNKASGSKKDGTFKLEKTEEYVKADKLTAGYMSPFNQFLRTKLVGVLAGSFMKCNSPYREYYDNYKARLEQSENVIDGQEKQWKEVSKGHRNNAAKRYMIKMFLKDLYVAWREIEGLEVRKPYQEEYLGHKHG